MRHNSNFHKAVFLDRDGVLNQAIIKNGKPYPPSSIHELKLFSDTLSSLLRLKKYGYLLICVTNQPDVARGKTARTQIETINFALMKQLPLNEIIVCYHDDCDQCECRKPKPGLILEAAEKYNIDTQKSFMIGDRWRDIEAGNRAQCKTIFLDYQYDEKQPTAMNYRTSSLKDAVVWILQQNRGV